jgi:DNA-3-methyladenine glycosylase I
MNDAGIVRNPDMATKMSKELKARGFKFCGPTIVYAFAQAVGIVNDHLVDCFRHEQVKKLAR